MYPNAANTKLMMTSFRWFSNLAATFAAHHDLFLPFPFGAGVKMRQQGLYALGRNPEELYLQTWGGHHSVAQGAAR